MCLAPAFALSGLQATGVPLVDYLGKLTVDEAVKQSIYLVAAAAVGVAVGAIVLKVVGSRAGSDTDADGSFNPLGAALASVVAPTRALLPFYGIAFSATVASSLAQVGWAEGRSGLQGARCSAFLCFCTLADQPRCSRCFFALQVTAVKMKAQFNTLCCE